MSSPDRLQAALAAIDAVNAADPRRVSTPSGERPKELWAAERVTAWLERLCHPDAPGELLRLAGRAHHLRRWAIPRGSFPEGRTGYLQWRRALHDLHADEVAPLLQSAGYAPDEIARVQDLLRKKGLGRAPADAELQLLEDALCLSFLDGGELAELAARLDDEKLVEVIRKTLAKMSEAGRALALTVTLGAREAALVGRALAEKPPAPAEEP